MRKKIVEVRQRLGDALRAQFKKEIARATERIRTSIAPYSRFVRAEETRWSETRATLTTLRDKASSFRDRLAA